MGKRNGRTQGMRLKRSRGGGAHRCRRKGSGRVDDQPSVKQRMGQFRVPSVSEVSKADGGRGDLENEGGGGQGQRSQSKGLTSRTSHRA